MSLPQHLKSSGTADIAWGVGELATYGIVQTAEEGKEETATDARDKDGKVVIHTVYDTPGSCTLTVLMKSGATPPAIGDTVTWDNVKYFCRGVTKTAQNDQYTQLRMALGNYPGIQLGPRPPHSRPAPATPSSTAASPSVSRPAPTAWSCSPSRSSARRCSTRRGRRS